MQIANVLLIIIALMVPLTSNTAEVLENDDYLAIRVEAEDFASKDERWYLNSDSVDPGIEIDADVSHASAASASAYMEVLPDYRQTSEDSIVNGYWAVGGLGPTIDYSINFPEPGRYMVYVRSYSTGTEDNSVHAGINGSWPGQARSLQVPCGPKNAWIWANRQRTADFHCGDPDFPVFLDIPSSGAQTVSFSAREDGYELDSFFLIKNKSNENVICSPSGADAVSCKAGSFNFADGFVDLEMNLTSTAGQVRVGDLITVTHTISNNDKKDMATSVEITANLSTAFEFESSDSLDCSSTAEQMTCSVGNLMPQASKTYEIDYRLLEAGSINYQVTSSSTEIDEISSNDSAALEVNVFVPGTVADISITGAANKNPASLGDSITYSFTVQNSGLDDSPDVVITSTLPAGGEIVSFDSSCTGETQILCELGALAVNESKSVKIDLSYSVAGQHTFSATAQATYDVNSDNDTVDVEVFAGNGTRFEESAGLLVVEAEAFMLNQMGEDSGGSAWYLVSEDVKPDVEIYNDTTPLSTASDEGYVVALGDSEVVTSGEGAVLSYSVFFNTVGTYYLQVRGHRNRDDYDLVYPIDGRALVSLDSAITSTSQVLEWCHGDTEPSWHWAGGTEISGNCLAIANGSVVQPLALEVNVPGQHIISFSIRDTQFELDKFVLSSDISREYSAQGPVAVEYADKNIDLDLQVDTDQLELDTNESAELVVTLTNNHSTAAASNIRLVISTSQSFNPDITSNSDCSVSENANVQEMICDLTALSPSESRAISVPIRFSETGNYTANITVAAEQSDDQLENNERRVTISVVSLGAASSEGDGGIFGLLALLAGFGLIVIRFYRRIPL